MLALLFATLVLLAPADRPLALADTTLAPADTIIVDAPASPEARADTILAKTQDSPEAMSMESLRPSVQPLADSTREPITFRPRLAPSALYSNARGIGIGAGVGIRNILYDGSDVTFDVRLSQRYQALALSAFTADPFESAFFGVVTLQASMTNRQRYYGIGPFSNEENRLFLDYRSLDAEARIGAYPLGNTGLFLQPSARFLADNLRDIEEDDEGALERLTQNDPASFRALTRVEDEKRYGASFGLEIASDLRDWRAYPRRGTFVSVEGRRFYALDDSDLRYNRLAISTLGYLPIRGRTALIGRSNLIMTRADEGADIPFYYLPVLDSRLLAAYPPDRFVGRDVLAFGGGIRFPIRDFIGVYGIDALVMGYLGNAYTDVFDQVSADVTFSQGALTDDGGRVPFRPALGIGLGIVNLDKERVVLGGLIGISPDGISVATLRIAYDLRDARPLFR